jgi:LDH2 family malate/lactate/ureidoglycolate dehydrogenase
MGLHEFRERMGVLYEKVVGCERMEGVDRIYFPGEIEQDVHEERSKSGIPYVEAEVEALNKEAELVGRDKIEVMSNSGT